MQQSTARHTSSSWDYLQLPANIQHTFDEHSFSHCPRSRNTPSSPSTPSVFLSCTAPALGTPLPLPETAAPWPTEWPYHDGEPKWNWVVCLPDTTDPAVGRLPPLADSDTPAPSSLSGVTDRVPPSPRSLPSLVEPVTPKPGTQLSLPSPSPPPSILSPDTPPPLPSPSTPPSASLPGTLPSISTTPASANTASQTSSTLVPVPTTETAEEKREMSYWHENRAYRRSRATHPRPYDEARGPYYRTGWDPNFHLPRRGVDRDYSPPSLDIGPVDDWRRIPASQLQIEEFSQLFSEAGLSLWMGAACSLRLCDADRVVRAELLPPRSYGGPRTPASILNIDRFRRISPCAATCSELTELLAESRLRLYENSIGDLHLRERNGTVLGILRRP